MLIIIVSSHDEYICKQGIVCCTNMNRGISNMLNAVWSVNRNLGGGGSPLLNAESPFDMHSTTYT